MVEMVARTNLTLVAHRRSFSGRVRAAMAGAPGCGALCGGRKRPAAAPKSAKTGERSLRKGGDKGIDAAVTCCTVLTVVGVRL